jgi:hypothetical protein
MTQAGQTPVVEVKPQPNIYTVLLIVAILALAVTLGFVIYNLTTPVADGGYGLSFGELFTGPENLPATPAE